MPRFLLLALLMLAAASAQEAARVSSPDGLLTLAFTVPASGPSAGALVYEASYRGKPLLAPGRLGLKPAGQPALGESVKIAGAQTGQVNQSYALRHGRTLNPTHRANTAVVTVEETRGLRRRLEVEVRVGDEGFGLRYRVPQQAVLREIEIERELTQFHLAREGGVWALALNGFRTSFEDNYTAAPLTGLKQNALFTLPLVAEVPGAAWIAITEAHLENYAGMYLTRPQGRILEAKLAPRADAPEIAVRAATPMTSPWRVVMVAPEPARLLENNLVTHLSPASRLPDDSWVKPGKTSWSWWSGDLAEGVSFQPGMNTATMKHYIDFSAEAGLEYVLIDEGWSGDVGGRARDLTKWNPNIDLPEIIRYAQSKNVRVWLWAYWTFVDQQMDEAFPLFEKWGVAGVKVDFMDRDDQTMVDYYHRVAKKAAQHRLMVDFHGAYKPAGMMRYYPNVLTHEGVLGLEYLKWSNRATAGHNVIVGFTRGLAGPMDYTPGGFNNVRPWEFEPRNRKPMVPTTRAHQMALYVVYETGFLMLADYPGAYRGQKELEFIKAVPVAWDETRGLAGHPDRYLAVARRKGKDWYIGVITNGEAREIELPLAFLGAGVFSAECWTDGAEPKATNRETQPVDASTKLKLKLAEAGGAAVVIRPKIDSR